MISSNLFFLQCKFMVYLDLCDQFDWTNGQKLVAASPSCLHTTKHKRRHSNFVFIKQPVLILGIRQCWFWHTHFWWHKELIQNLDSPYTAWGTLDVSSEMRQKKNVLEHVSKLGLNKRRQPVQVDKKGPSTIILLTSQS